MSSLVSHVIDAKSRALQVRLRFDNPDEQLKPNMYVSVEIAAEPRENALAVPREALIRTGRSERVVAALSSGRFLPVDVETGIESGNYIEVSSGLEEGDRVVTSGQFLIDSESSLTASFQRMTDPEPAATGDATETEQAAITATGTINTLEPLNVSHAPIPALGWPEQSMTRSAP